MKKFVAILLTLMLVLGIGAAVADEAPATPTTDLTDHETVKIKKVYKLEGAGTSPEETFTLKQVGDGTVTNGEATSAPALGTITGATFAAGAATAKGATGEITVALPKYTSVGVYEYTLQEVAGTTAGVTYYGETIKLVVTVVNGKNNDLLRIAGVHTESSGDKTDTFENTYRAGTLNVTKKVDGNLGDQSKKFDFTVKFTKPDGEDVNSTITATVAGVGATDFNIAWDDKGMYTYTFQLAHGQTASFVNLPYGVSYIVTETGAEEKDGVLMNGDYKVTMTGNEGVIGSTATEAKFVNTKEGSIDTGVTTENLPYVLLIGFVVLAGAALLIKRKAHNN